MRHGGGGVRARGRAREQRAAEAAGGLLGEGGEFVIEVGLVGVSELEGEFGERELGIAEQAGPAFGEADDFGQRFGRKAELGGEAALEMAGRETLGAGEGGDGEAAGGGGEGADGGGDGRRGGGMAEEPGLEEGRGFGEAGGAEQGLHPDAEGIEGGAAPSTDAGGKQAGAEDADGAEGAYADDAGLEAEDGGRREGCVGGAGVEEEGIAGGEEELEAAVGPDFLHIRRGRVVDAPESFDAGELGRGRVFGIAHSSGYRGCLRGGEA
jgi:hypothetical protein